MTTNPDAVLYLDGTEHTWQPGEFWYGDCSREHAVRNLGTTTRVHAVIDVLFTIELAALFPPAWQEQLTTPTRSSTTPPAGPDHPRRPAPHPAPPGGVHRLQPRPAPRRRPEAGRARPHHRPPHAHHRRAGLRAAARRPGRVALFQGGTNTVSSPTGRDEDGWNTFLTIG
ncbi:aspartyl/asparaginyl beta-hydroxylase domain-containing protein [Streptomyces virginiae]|uniref:aspartyl/asparaginyl beta-hydroxylase domain-containing protein n=1 Tax=Streptomyces virginiae TaxID=1961 RepID=UPI00386E3A52